LVANGAAHKVDINVFTGLTLIIGREVVVETPSSPEIVPPADQQLNVAVSRATDEVVVLRVAGEIDLLTANLLGERVREQQLLPTNRVVVLDLSGVSFMGSSGLAEIVAAAQADSAQLVLVATSRAVLRPLEATGLLPMLTIYESVDEAIAGVH
jgi:anti-sigma B factor antagonist